MVEKIRKADKEVLDFLPNLSKKITRQKTEPTHSLNVFRQ